MLYGYLKHISISRITIPIVAVVVDDSISERVIEVECVVVVLFAKLDIVVVDESIKEK